MFILYIQTGCPYCAIAIGVFDALGLPFESRNIRDITHREELLRRGGKIQVPYLVDVSRNVEMYESADIVRYIQTHYQDHGESSWSTVSG